MVLWNRLTPKWQFLDFSQYFSTIKQENKVVTPIPGAKELQRNQFSKWYGDQPTDQRTNQRTNKRTNGPMDGPT
jgi:hypothetical protein